MWVDTTHPPTASSAVSLSRCAELTTPFTHLGSGEEMSVAAHSLESASLISGATSTTDRHVDPNTFMFSSRGPSSHAANTAVPRYPHHRQTSISDASRDDATTTATTTSGTLPHAPTHSYGGSTTSSTVDRVVGCTSPEKLHGDDESGAVSGGSSPARRATPWRSPRVLALQHEHLLMQEHAPSRGSSPTAREDDGCSWRDTDTPITKAAELSERCSSTSSEESMWLLLPRRHGVNEALLGCSSPPPAMADLADVLPLPSITTSLREQAEEVLAGALRQPISIRLHANSAGGTYLVHRVPGDEVLAVFKPRDQEIGQPNNPHGNTESDRTAHFSPGMGSRREVLAYRLDHGHFAGVPATMEAATQHVYHANTSPRHQQPQCIGSLQAFVPSCTESVDVLPGHFDVHDVHALAIFDIRTLNGDRHGGNVLVYRQQPREDEIDGDDAHVKDGRMSTLDDGHINIHARPGASSSTLRLVPIDHSYICPSGYAEPDYEWLSWPQSKEPFSPRCLDYIRQLDGARDAEMVRTALLAKSVKTESERRARTFPASRRPAATEPHEEVEVADYSLGINGLASFYPQSPHSPVCGSSESWANSLVVMSPMIENGVHRGWPQLPNSPQLSFCAATRQASTSQSNSMDRSEMASFHVHLDAPCVRSEEVLAAEEAAEMVLTMTRFLQICALEFGYTARRIGTMCRRPTLATPSVLEELLEQARDASTWNFSLSQFEDATRRFLSKAPPPL